MDMYNDASKIVDSNFDDPRLSDYELLEQNLRDLRTGKSAEIPIYDFKTSTRPGYRTQDSPTARSAHGRVGYYVPTMVRAHLRDTNLSCCRAG